MKHTPHYRNMTIPDLTIRNVLRDLAAQRGEKTFLSYLPDRRSYTYGQIDALSNRIANSLLERGIGKGAHVALLTENCPEQVLTFLALGKLGAVSVSINASARGEQLAYFLRQSDSSAVVAERRLVSRIMDVQAAAPLLRTIIVIEDGTAAEADDEDRGLRVAFADLAEGQADLADQHVSFRDPAMIMYTSGTTGPSKGCLFNQARSLLWGMSHAEAHGYRYSDVFYICMPLFHVSALHGTLYNAMTLGASVVLQRGFSATHFWSDVRENAATVANMMGSMANLLWAKPASADDGNHCLRMCQVSPVPHFAVAFEERFRIRFVAGYGLTDYASSHAFTLSDPVWKMGSAGRTRRGIAARIVDDDDFDVATGAVGELILRNDNAWEWGEGYYKLPEATVESMRNGWFHTGDTARIDADGYMWFVGRTKDAIRRRGENISAYEIEKIVATHEAIAESAAFALSSEFGEDDVGLAVVLKDGCMVSEADLVRHCAAHMAYFMVPRYVIRLAELPRTLSHKVQKFRLKETYEADRTLLWDRDAAGITIAR